MAVPGKVIVHPDAQEFSFSASSKRLPFKERSKVGWFTCCSFYRVAMRSGFVFFTLGTIWFDVNHRLAHPRRPRGSQSGREKRPDESFQARAEEPLCTDSHRTISKRSSECWLLIGHKKCFLLLCPIGEQFLMSSCREFVHVSGLSSTFSDMSSSVHGVVDGS